MPNWCENIISITGSEADINKFWEENQKFSFSKYVKNKDKKYRQEVWNNMSRIDKGNWTFETWWYNIAIPDSLDGYHWNQNNFGTKWEVDYNSDSFKMVKKSKTRIMMYFDTAWSPSEPVTLAMAMKYPNLKFNHKYYEMGCEFKGTLEVKGDIILQNVTEDYHGNRGG